MEEILKELIKELREIIEYLWNENADLKAQNAAVLAHSVERDQTIANPTKTVEYLKRKFYGSSSERPKEDEPAEAGSSL